MDQAGGVPALLVRGIQPAVPDVVQHGTAEEFRFLQDDTQRAAEIRFLDARDAEAIDHDASVLDLVEAVDEVRDGGLPRPGSAHEGDLLAGIGREGDVEKYLFLRDIAEVHVLQFHQAFQFPRCPVRFLPGPFVLPFLFKDDGARIHFGGLVQEGVETVRTGRGHDDGVDLVGDLGDRTGKVALEGEERDQGTQGEGDARNMAQRDQGAQDGQQDIHEVANVGVDGHDNVADLVGIIDAGAELLVEPGELLHGLFLVAIHFHDLLAGDHLLDESVHPAQVPLPLHEIFPGQLPEARRHLVHQESHQGRHDGQRDAHDDHAHKGGRDGHERPEQARNGVPDHLPERVHIVRIDGHDVAMRMIVKILQGKRLHVREQVLPDLEHGALPHMDHDERLGIAGDDAHEDDGAEFGERHSQRCKVRRGSGSHRRNVIVDERARKERRGERSQGRHQDAQEHHDEVHLVVLEDVPEQAEDRGVLLEVPQGGPGPRSAVPSPSHITESRRHKRRSFGFVKVARAAAGLHFMDFLVDAAGTQEVLMRIEGDHAAVVHHDDAVRFLDGQDALGDNEFGRPGDARVEGCPDGGVRRRIHGRGGIVQDQHLRVLQERPGDAQALPLAAGDIGPALVDHGVVPVREALDELIGTGLPAGFLAFLQGGVFLSPAEVFQDGSGEERALLEHHGDLVPEDLHVVFPDIDAAHFHRSLGHVIEARHQVRQGRFTGAGTTDEADGLSRPDMQVDVLQGVIAALLIGEIDVVEVDASVGDGRNRLRGIVHIWLFVNHFRYTGGARRALGELDEDHGQHHEGTQDRHDVAEKRSKLAGGKTPLHDEMRAIPAQGDDAGIHDKVHHRTVQGHERLRLHVQVEQTERRLVELAHLVVLPDEGLHDADGIDILLHYAVHGVHLEEDLLEKLRRAGDEDAQEHAQDDHRHQENDTQLLMDEETHRQGGDHVQWRAERGAQQHLESVLDAGHVRGHPRHQAGGGELVDVREGEALDVPVHRQAQVRREAGAAVGSEPARQNTENQAQDGDPDHHPAVLVHVGETPRPDSLVDDGRRHIRDQDAHDHLQGGPKRSKQRSGLVLLDLS